MDIQSQAVVAYRAARGVGMDPWDAAQAAWLAVRPARSRAPRWDRAVERNTAGCRTYYSPLGRALGVAGGEWGAHVPGLPRPVDSVRAEADVRAAILRFLEEKSNEIKE